MQNCALLCFTVLYCALLCFTLLCCCVDVSFKHGHDLPPVPGWLLTEVWMADQGITHKGVLTVEYKTSGEPNRGFRNLLSDMVRRVSAYWLMREISLSHSCTNAQTLVHVRRLALQLADECRGVGAAVPSRLSQDEGKLCKDACCVQ